MPFLHAIGKGSSPYHRRTCAAAPSDFRTESEGAPEEVRRW